MRIILALIAVLIISAYSVEAHRIKSHESKVTLEEGKELLTLVKLYLEKKKMAKEFHDDIIKLEKSHVIT